jgi:ATP/maltotriose-dependent transcriptional regulator MalT
MIDLASVKVTPRDQQVLNLLVQGCSNKELPANSRSARAPSNSI